MQIANSSLVNVRSRKLHHELRFQWCSQDERKREKIISIFEFVAVKQTIKANQRCFVLLSFHLSFGVKLRIYGFYVFQSKDLACLWVSIFDFFLLKNKWLLCLHFTLNRNCWPCVLCLFDVGLRSSSTSNFQLESDCHRVKQSGSCLLYHML